MLRSRRLVLRSAAIRAFCTKPVLVDARKSFLYNPARLFGTKLSDTIKKYRDNWLPRKKEKGKDISPAPGVKGSLIEPPLNSKQIGTLPPGDSCSAVQEVSNLHNPFSSTSSPTPDPQHQLSPNSATSFSTSGAQGRKMNPLSMFQDFAAKGFSNTVLHRATSGGIGGPQQGFNDFSGDADWLQKLLKPELNDVLSLVPSSVVDEGMKAGLRDIGKFVDMRILSRLAAHGSYNHPLFVNAIILRMYALQQAEQQHIEIVPDFDADRLSNPSSSSSSFCQDANTDTSTVVGAGTAAGATSVVTELRPGGKAASDLNNASAAAGPVGALQGHESLAAGEERLRVYIPVAERVRPSDAFMADCRRAFFFAVEVYKQDAPPDIMYEDVILNEFVGKELAKKKAPSLPSLPSLPAVPKIPNISFADLSVFPLSLSVAIAGANETSSAAPAGVGVLKKNLLSTSAGTVHTADLGGESRSTSKAQHTAPAMMTAPTKSSPTAAPACGSVPEPDSLLCASHVKVPRHMVVLDHLTRSVLVAIRGTTSASDIITDLCMDTVPFLQLSTPRRGTPSSSHSAASKDDPASSPSHADGSSGDAGSCPATAPRVLYAHEGIADSARALLGPISRAIAHARQRKGGRYKDYRVVLTGHSLGAAVSCLLSLLLSHEAGIANTTFAFAPPACLSEYHITPHSSSSAQVIAGRGSSSSLLDELTKGAPVQIYSFVNNEDVVPRCCSRELLHMIEALKRLDALPWTPLQRSVAVLNGGLSHGQMREISAALFPVMADERRRKRHREGSSVAAAAAATETLAPGAPGAYLPPIRDGNERDSERESGSEKHNTKAGCAGANAQPQTQHIAWDDAEQIELYIPGTVYWMRPTPRPQTGQQPARRGMKRVKSTQSTKSDEDSTDSTKSSSSGFEQLRSLLFRSMVSPETSHDDASAKLRTEAGAGTGEPMTGATSGAGAGTGGPVTGATSGAGAGTGEPVTGATSGAGAGTGEPMTGATSGAGAADGGSQERRSKRQRTYLAKDSSERAELATDSTAAAQSSSREFWSGLWSGKRSKGAPASQDPTQDSSSAAAAAQAASPATVSSKSADKKTSDLASHAEAMWDAALHSVGWSDILQESRRRRQSKGQQSRPTDQTGFVGEAASGKANSDSAPPGSSAVLIDSALSFFFDQLPGLPTAGPNWGQAARQKEANSEPDGVEQGEDKSCKKASYNHEALPAAVADGSSAQAVHDANADAAEGTDVTLDYYTDATTDTNAYHPIEMYRLHSSADLYTGYLLTGASMLNDHGTDAHQDALMRVEKE